MPHFQKKYPLKYASSQASGIDLRAMINTDLIIQPMERKRIPTGIQIAIPKGYEGQVRPRSGLAWKHGLTLLNSPGTIDSDYRGEILIITINLGDKPIKIMPYDRIAQFVITPMIQCQIQYVDSLCTTERNEGGFGSTGIH